MSLQEKLGKAAYQASHANAETYRWEDLRPAAKAPWIAAAEAAVEADAMDHVNHMFCSEHFNSAERGEVPKFEKCIVCIRDDMRAHLKTILSKNLEIQGLMHDLETHRKAVGQFLSDMYCTMIDPLAEGTSKVEDTCKLLLKAATEQRQQLADYSEALHAYAALDEQRNICEECEDRLERAPETCELCFPFADRARLLMRKALGIAQPEVQP